MAGRKKQTLEAARDFLELRHEKLNVSVSVDGDVFFPMINGRRVASVYRDTWPTESEAMAAGHRLLASILNNMRKAAAARMFRQAKKDFKSRSTTTKHLSTIVIDEPTTDAQADENRKAGRKMNAAVNIATRIGALYMIRDRDTHHEEAAKLFKSRYESLYGNGLGASDTAKEPVDTSFRAHDAGMARVIDNGRELALARDALPTSMWNAVVACVVLCAPPGHQVDNGKMSDRQRRKAGRAKADEILNGLDIVAAVWNLRSKRRAA